MKGRSRRQFLKESFAASAVAGASVIGSKAPVAANTSPQARIIGANDRIRFGLIGCGGMGRSDLRDFMQVKNVECAALCDVDDAQSAEAGRLTQQGSQNPGLITRDFRRVLEQRDIDAVIVATPDHWHALPTIMACQAGKDVYVEKPLSVCIAEGRAMVDTARKHNRVVQMGTQQRSAPHYTEAVEFVKGGQLGKIRLVRAWAYLDWKGE